MINELPEISILIKSETLNSINMLFIEHSLTKTIDFSIISFSFFKILQIIIKQNEDFDKRLLLLDEVFYKTISFNYFY